ncbi:hypothetical protein [Candidatus Amarolinea dominans]|uniref:AAA family ATPase n=1 Tax=Candidatus Amarolinea dominans TaxID=3140696 RepID=UPI001D5BB797|nr:ATP-binding protein [Anaerolineae bacterium]
MTQARGAASALTQMQPQPSLTSGVVYVPPPAYETDKFVAREKLLQGFRDQLKEAKHGQSLRQIIMLWGVSGLGKTWIIRHLAHELGHDQPDAQQKGSFAIVFDFAEDTVRHCETLDALLRTFTQSVQQAIHRLENQLNTDERREIALINEAIAGGQSPEEIARAIVCLFQALSERFVPICLFDSLDILEDTHFDWFAWFEEHLWMPIGRDSRMLLVFAARKEMKRFQQFEVRRRLKRWQVLPFKTDEVTAQLKQERRVAEAELVGNILYPYSFGHPYATWRLGEGLAALTPAAQPIDERVARQFEKDFADLLGTVIEWWLNHVNWDVRQRLLAAATLRHFHIRALQMFLAETENNDDLRAEPDSYFQDIIKSMLGTDLTFWSQIHHGYIIDPTVRKIINRWLLLTDADEYDRRHRSAKDLYVRLIRESQPLSATYIIAAIYHDAMRAKARAGGDTPWSVIEPTVTAYLDPVTSRLDLEGVTTLQEELERDDELRELLGECYQELTERVDALARVVSQHSSNGATIP